MNRWLAPALVAACVVTGCCPTDGPRTESYHALNATSFTVEVAACPIFCFANCLAGCSPLGELAAGENRDFTVSCSGNGLLDCQALDFRSGGSELPFCVDGAGDWVAYSGTKPSGCN